MRRFRLREVAPRAGAWIETQRNRSRNRHGPSPPVRGRGLKRQSRQKFFVRHVAPRAWAWIETSTCPTPIPCLAIAPRAWAWIETAPPIRTGSSPPVAPPVLGRGLKLVVPRWRREGHRVAPRAGAWIETPLADFRRRERPRSPPVLGRGLKHGVGFRRLVLGESPPVRGRGLKRSGDGAVWRAGESLPVRGRGLKLVHSQGSYADVVGVAPRAGAWWSSALPILEI